MNDDVDWHAWYVNALGIIAGWRRDLAVGEITRSWRRVERPLALRIPNPDVERTADMLVGDDGALYHLTPGPVPGGRLAVSERWAMLHDGDREVRRYLVYDPTNPEATPRTEHEVSRGYRRYKGALPVRSSPQPGPVARALAIHGLMEAGRTHEAALREWLAWPESAHDLASLPAPEREQWHNWERALYQQHKRIWESIGVDPELIAIDTWTPR